MIKSEVQQSLCTKTESHHPAVYHLPISLQLLSVLAHFPSYINALLAELYVPLISIKGPLLTFLALSLFGHSFLLERGSKCRIAIWGDTVLHLLPHWVKISGKG